MKLRLMTLFLAGVLAAGCSDDETTGPAGEAQIRVVHASPDAPNVDVLVDGDEVLGDVPYLAASDYLDVPAGVRNVRVNGAGTTTSVIDEDIDLVEGTAYTIIASGFAASLEALVLTDDNTAPAAGNAKVRAIHGAPSAPPVDIYVTAPGVELGQATPVLGGVAFGDVADYVEVPAGNYQVRATLAGTTTVVIDSGTLTLASGQVRTAIAVDAAGGGAPLDLLVLADSN